MQKNNYLSIFMQVPSVHFSVISISVDMRLYEESHERLHATKENEKKRNQQQLVQERQIWNLRQLLTDDVQESDRRQDQRQADIDPIRKVLHRIHDEDNEH